MMAGSEANIRLPQFADNQWYPAREDDLRQTIAALIEAAPYRDLGRPIGLIAPHAGLRFSGGVAARAYRQLEGQRYDLVVVISPLHRHAFGSLVVTRYASYLTPLGEIPLAEDVIRALEESLPIVRVERDDEHSLEIQLPFLQYMLGGFSLVPVMMGDQSLPACQLLADTLAATLEGRSVLIVASSDLSHFHNYDAAKRLDHLIVEQVQEFDPAGLAQVLVQGKAEACGGGPMIATMLAAKALGADKAAVLQYANSGDVWVDKSSVVGYLAAAFYRTLE